MLLAIDVGNTHTVFGLYEGPQLCHHWRLQTNRGGTADEYGVVLRSWLANVSDPAIAGVVVSSVVPSMNQVLATMTRYIHTSILFRSSANTTIVEQTPSESTTTPRIVRAGGSSTTTFSFNPYVGFMSGSGFELGLMPGLASGRHADFGLLAAGDGRVGQRQRPQRCWCETGATGNDV